MNEEIILISSITPSSRRAYEIARLFPGRKIIMGGVHVSALPHEAVEYADHVVVGECESKRKRAMAVLTSMKAEGIRPKVIAANSRLQVYKDRELLQCLSGHNITLCIGIESLNQAVLDGYQKEQKETEILEAIKTLRDYGIKVMGYFIFGADQDDKDTLKSYSEFIDKSKIDFFQVSVLTLYPGTEFYKNLVLQKRLFTTDWTYYDGLHITFRPAKMTAYELQKEFLDFYKKEFSLKFLLNPRWLFNPEILRNKLLIYTLRKMFNKDMINYYSFLETNSNKTIN